MENNAYSVKEKLERLRAGYADDLGPRIDELTVLLTNLSEAGDGAPRKAALDRMHMAVHKLVGSGATFGYPEVTKIAQDMEQEYLAVLDGKAAFDPGIIARHTELTARLREAARAQSGSAVEESEEIARAALRDGLDDNHHHAVVVLDCDPEEAEQMRREMEHFGYDVHVIGSLEQLEQELAGNHFDVVVSDLEFEGEHRDVLDVLGGLHEKGVLGAPLVVYTDLDGIEPRLGAARIGATAYMVKPRDMADVVDELDAVTHRVEREPFRVLIIDDDESLAGHTDLVLQGAGMETMVLNDPMRVLDALDDFSPELILLDLYMPECSGSEIASVIRQRQEFAGIPIVFLSGEADKDKQLSAMELGGDDFLTKPIRPAHLISSVRIRASRFRELRSFMVRDSMTGLYNHTTTKQLMETEISRARRAGAKMSLASLDIDHFKNVNDTYGHAVGDKVIKALARLLRQRLRAADVIGRMGGEEFAAVLPDTAIGEAEKVFNQIREAFSGIVFQAADHTFTVTISCGIAEFRANDTATKLSDAADKALYVAKNGGRNQVVLAD